MLESVRKKERWRIGKSRKYEESKVQQRRSKKSDKRKKKEEVEDLVVLPKPAKSFRIARYLSEKLEYSESAKKNL